MVNEIYPKKITTYDSINARLGIKSSFKNAKRNIALLTLLWLSNNELANYSFFEPDDNKIVLKKRYLENLFNFVKPFLDKNISTNYHEFSEYVNGLELVTCQLEPTQVTFQLVWRLAAVSFEDETLPDGKERTGSKRYPKKISFTSNLDLIKYAFIGEEKYLNIVLVKWLLTKSDISMSTDLPDIEVKQSEEKLLKILSLLSDQTAFKITEQNEDLIFQKTGIYQSIVDNGESSEINISGDKEVKGPLRIMSAAIKNDVEPYLENTDSKHVKLKGISVGDIKNYSKRVETNLSLQNVDIKGELKQDKEKEKGNVLKDDFESGKNIIYYGAPGTGKSYAVNEEVKKYYPDYASDESISNVFRVTLHPEYTYSDFVGQLQPYTDDKRNLSYKFIPGIFTYALKEAINHPDKPVFLILEELSRANVAAVFGDLFQLLDRKNGQSEYSINNPDIAQEVYDDESAKVVIPSNMTILGTVNTSDQNVYPMDTAFKRRFEWRYVSTDEGSNSDAFMTNNNPKLDIGNGKRISWKDLYQGLNKFIVGELGLTEDKQIGPYFIKFEGTSEEEAHNLVKDKLLQYLWEDINTAANTVYGADNNLFMSKETIPSFSVLYDRFDKKEQIFSDEFLEKLGVNNGTEPIED